MKKIILVLLLLLISVPVAAEIEKNAIPSENGFDLYWWPVLPKIDGWHQDVGSSYRYRANTQVPDGATFSNAESVIYAKALYKPRMSDTKSLEQLIAEDIEEFKKSQSALAIEKSGLIKTKDNKTLEIYRFSPKGEGNWEKVAYGEEGDFYLVFALSSRTEQGYTGTLPTFKEFIQNYEEHPNQQIKADEK